MSNTGKILIVTSLVTIGIALSATMVNRIFGNTHGRGHSGTFYWDSSATSKENPLFANVSYGGWSSTPLRPEPYSFLKQTVT
jgi:hypothetical protein